MTIGDDGLMHFTYSPKTFPFHADCYEWPKVSATGEQGDIELNVHCLRNMEERQFSLVGFIGLDREEQISAVIFLAQQAGAEVIAFKGVGFTDEILYGLMMSMVEMDPDKDPGKFSSLMPVEWPTRFQRRVLREAVDMSRHGDFHEESLAYRMKAPVEEIRQHLELLADLGLMEAK